MFAIINDNKTISIYTVFSLQKKCVNIVNVAKRGVSDTSESVEAIGPLNNIYHIVTSYIIRLASLLHCSVASEMTVINTDMILEVRSMFFIIIHHDSNGGDGKSCRKGISA